jgi:ElaA protein
MFAIMHNSGTARPGATITIHWQWARLHELSVVDLYAVMVARQRVFAIEQSCTFLDADGLDAYAWHLLGWPDHGARHGLAAYLRVIDPGHKFPEPSIGRVLTAADHRRVGLGRVLMKEGLARTEGTYPGTPIRIAAQYRLEPFYVSFGFRTVSPIFQEDGIAHVEMLYAAFEGHAAPRPESSRQFG